MDIAYILKGILIAIVEGITEFLPISSTGHLIIANYFLGFGDGPFERMFMVVIQLGAILAIIVLYWDKLWGFLLSLLRGEQKGKRFAAALLIGVLPAAVLGFTVEDFIDENLFSVPTVILGLIVGAMLMIWFEKRYRGRARVEKVEDISPSSALKVGLFQCLSLWPGMSRSASTIMGGWNQGLSPAVAAEYSFFLAIPIMFGASGVKLAKFGLDGHFSSVTATQMVTLVAGFAVAFLVALICVRAFMAYIKKRPMQVFAYYRFILAAFLIVFMFINR
jgi:undecaprenyl-diphosphatase